MKDVVVSIQLSRRTMAEYQGFLIRFLESQDMKYRDLASQCEVEKEQTGTFVCDDHSIINKALDRIREEFEVQEENDHLIIREKD